MRPRTAVVLLLLSPAAASAQARVGPEFQVNTYTTGGQRMAAVAADAQGEFVVTWISPGLDGDSYGIAARRYEASGAPIGGAEFRVNASTTGSQSRPAVSSDPAGGLTVLWQSSGDGSSTGVFGRRFDENGGILGGDFRVNTYTTDNQVQPRVGTAGDGRFVTVWVDFVQDGGQAGIFGQRYDASGAPAGPEFRVNSYTTNHQNFADVGVAADGRFVVVWWSGYQDGSGEDIFGQRYDGAGAPAGGEFRVNVLTMGSQDKPAITVRGDGSFVVVWESNAAGADDVAGRRFDAAGTPVGGEFLVNQYTTGSQYEADVAADGEGNFLVAWSGDALGGRDVFGRWFDPSGTPQGAEFRINTYTTGAQSAPAVAPVAGGRFIVTWVSDGQDGSGFGVFGQLLAPDVIFRDDFESGSLADWSSSATDGGDLSVSTDAAMNFSVGGLRAVVDDTAGLFVQDDRPDDEGRYRARFYFDPNGFDPGESQLHLRTRIFIVFEEAPTRRLAAVVLRRQAGVYALMLRCRLDDNSQDNGGFVTISDGPHAVELDWKRSSGPAAADGSCRMSVDGAEVSARTGLDNSVSGVDFVRLGALSVKNGASGSLYWDEFDSRRLNPIGP